MILCVGTTPAVQRILVFEQLRPGEVNRAVECYLGSAGKSINVAKVAHALGAPVKAISFVGGDTGEVIRHSLEEEGVPHEFTSTASPTRVCTTVIERGTGTITELVEEARPVSEGDVAALWRCFETHIAAAKLLVLSGSLAPGVPKDLYTRCMSLASRRGVPTLIDAQTHALRSALAERPLLVKPNRAELAATIGRSINSEEELRQAARELIAMGPSWAAITDGGRSVVLSDGEQFFRATPPRVEAVNPIGSGDAFAAGLAVGIVKGKAIPEALKTAIACGASNALHMLPGRIDPQQVERFESEVKIERLA